MVKERYLRNLQNARRSNVRLLHSLKLLVSGLDIEKHQFTLQLTETPFGKWFYGEAMLFLSEKTRRCLEEIETTLLAFHEHFTKIYTIYYGRRARGLMRLLGIKNSISPSQRASAQSLYDEMIHLSDRLKQQMHRLESLLEEIAEETFSQLAHQHRKRILTA